MNLFLNRFYFIIHWDFFSFIYFWFHRWFFFICSLGKINFLILFVLFWMILMRIMACALSWKMFGKEKVFIYIYSLAESEFAGLIITSFKRIAICTFLFCLWSRFCIFHKSLLNLNLWVSGLKNFSFIFRGFLQKLYIFNWKHLPQDVYIISVT